MPAKTKDFLNSSLMFKKRLNASNINKTMHPAPKHTLKNKQADYLERGFPSPGPPSMKQQLKCAEQFCMAETFQWT